MTILIARDPRSQQPRSEIRSGSIHVGNALGRRKPTADGRNGLACHGDVGLEDAGHGGDASAADDQVVEDALGIPVIDPTQAAVTMAPGTVQFSAH
jgi:hypothetical protein